MHKPGKLHTGCIQRPLTNVLGASTGSIRNVRLELKPEKAKPQPRLGRTNKSAQRMPPPTVGITCDPLGIELDRLCTDASLAMWQKQLPAHGNTPESSPTHCRGSHGRQKSPTRKTQRLLRNRATPGCKSEKQTAATQALAATRTGRRKRIQPIPDAWVRKATSSEGAKKRELGSKAHRNRRAKARLHLYVHKLQTWTPHSQRVNCSYRATLV